MDLGQNQKKVGNGVFVGNTNVPSSGSSLQGVPIVSPDMGDIILGGSKEKKGHRWLVVILIIFVVLALILGGVLIWVNLARGNKSTSADIESSFNRYANYLLYGEDKTDALSYESVRDVGSSGYYLKTQAEQGSLSSDYLDNLKNYFQNFYTMIEGTIEGNEDEYPKSFLKNYKNQLDLIVTYYKNSPMMRGEILAEYVAGGETRARNYIEQRAQPFAEIDDIYNENYYDLLMEWGDDTLALLVEYDEMGCVDRVEPNSEGNNDEIEGRVDYGCVVEKTNEWNNDLSKRISKNSSIMYDMLRYSMDDISNYLFDIWDMVYNGDEVSDE